MRKLLYLLLITSAFAQNARYDAQFPSITKLGSVPYLVANVPPNSPTVAVCTSPANGVPCTNYATTFTGAGVACLAGAQDTPQPATTSACQPTGDAQGNIGFWAAPGVYDYTVCVNKTCYGPFTVQLTGSGGGASGNGAFTSVTSAQGLQALPPSLPEVDVAIDASGTCAYNTAILTANQAKICNLGSNIVGVNFGSGFSPFLTYRLPSAQIADQSIMQFQAVRNDWEASPLAVSLSTLGAASASSTLANGNNPLTWNWAQTTASQSGLTIGESVAAVGAGDSNLTLSTLAASTSTPLNIAQGSVTGASIPALSLSTTWNNGSTTDNLLNFVVTNTASNAASTFFTFNGGAGGATLEASLSTQGILQVANAVQGTAAGGSIQFCGGNCTVSSNGQVGNGIFQGADDTNNGSASKAGLGLLRGGILTNATPNAAALEGATQIGSGYLKGSAVAAVGDIVCGTTTAYTVTDCSHTGPATTILGVATSTTNPIGVVSYGEAQVALDNTATLGDNVCMGVTTDGKAHDNGTAACTVGTKIGVVIAVAGSVQHMTGSTQAAVTLSTSLPLVHLTID